MLLKLLQDGFGSAMDLNCAEKILYGANWAYNMKLPGEALKLAAGFGGGMGVESSCGVITGGVMVLSSLYVSRNGHESGRIKALEKEFIETFTKEDTSSASKYDVEDRSDLDWPEQTWNFTCSTTCLLYTSPSPRD